MVEHNALPSATTFSEVLERLRPALGRYAADPGLWAAAYEPDYARFDRREMRRVPVEWNPDAARQFRRRDPSNSIWLTRRRTDRGFQGLVIEAGSTTVSRTNDRQKLGWTKRQSDASTVQTP